jgi:phenylacetate-CoA ligase
MQWDSINRLKPTTLVAVPSFIMKLLEYAKQNGIDPNQSSVQKIICIGENLRTPELELNTLASRIKEIWNVTLISTYASTEMQTAFTECTHGRGGHHHPELVIVEILDEHHADVPVGEPGEITITTLGVEGMPLLRYKTGDIAQAYYEPCACGRTTLRLGPVLGRKQQMIKLRGTTIYPPAIFDLLNQVEAVTDYVVEVFTNDLEVDELKIHITSVNEEKSANSAKVLFQSRLRIIPEINFCSQQELESIHAKNHGRKVQRFIDKR